MNMHYNTLAEKYFLNSKGRYNTDNTDFLRQTSDNLFSK